MRLLALIPILYTCLSLNTLWAANKIEVKAGLMPFSLYTSGSVRLYYDTNSNISGISYYNNEGIKYATQERSYDSYGTVSRNTINETLGWFNWRSTSFDYEYSSTNRVLKETQSYGWDTRTLKYHYNLLGDVDKIQAYMGYFYPEKKESVESIYKIGGQLSVRHFCNSKGKRTLTQKWIYDELSGRLSEFQTLDGNGKLIWGTKHFYDAATGCDVETQFGSAGEVLSYIYTYRNELGQIYERDLRDSSAIVLNITMVNYNSLGQVTRVADYDRDHNLQGLVSTFYDAQARAYQHDFNYKDKAMLRDRITDYLYLPGNDL